MEGEPPKIYLVDCPEAVQTLARDVASEFQTAATWPTTNDVHVMRIERDIDDRTFSRYKYYLFNDWSDGQQARLRLNSWVLHDAGGFEDVFSAACRLVGKAFDEIRRTRKPV